MTLTFDPLPVIRLTPKTIHFEPFTICTYVSNLNKISPRVWPLERIQTDGQTDRRRMPKPILRFQLRNKKKLMVKLPNVAETISICKLS